MKNLKAKNLRNLLLGVFFTAFAVSLTDYFLPFFLKEKGFSALQIGGFFTLGLALGSLVFSVAFAKLLKKIKLRTGLVLAVIINLSRNLVLYIFPTLGGAIANQAMGEIYKPTSRISLDSSIQHNLTKGKERETSVAWLILDNIGLILGIVLSMILITKIGFKHTFLVFSIMALPTLLFYWFIDDKTRFVNKKIKKYNGISRTIKLLVFSEALFWFALAASYSLAITFLVSEKLSGGLFSTGIIFIALFSSMTLTTYLTKKIMSKFEEIYTAMFGMSLILISAILIILFDSFYPVLFAFILEGIGAGIWVPSKTALQWKYTNKEDREKVSGFLSGYRGAAASLGPLAGGFLITTIGVNAPFYLRSIVILISLSVYFYLSKQKLT